MAQTVELNSRGSGDGPARVPGPDPLIGHSLLHYRVIEVIGQGGMSVVYRGHDEHLHRDVAIKVLHPFLAEKAECRARLAREARAVARLEHPHILKVFDFSGDDTLETVEELPGAGRQNARGFAEGFIIAELVRGDTLKHFAEDHEIWKRPEVGAMVVWQIATALDHAHANGVVHRDLKPENVMVRDDGWLKLMDFGIAQIADQKGLTITGTLLGSPAHMAPECIDGHAADERSDLFSLGTVLYWITTGLLPFEALTPHALLKQIAEGRSIPAQQRSPAVSDDLARVIGRAMATKPADRFPNAKALVQALEEVLARAGLPADTQRLRAILASPSVELPKACVDVRAGFLKRAEQLLADRAPARALSCLNRVLADDKDDKDARALLERAQGDIGDEPTNEDEAPAVALAAQGAAHVVEVPMHLAEASSTSLPVRARVTRFARQAGLIAIAGGLIAAAFVVAIRSDDARDQKNDAASAPAVVVPRDTVVGDDGTSTGQPEFETGTVDTTDVVVSKKRGRDVGKIVSAPPPKVDPPVVSAPASSAPSLAGVAKRQVSLRVKRSWADMFVDGVQVAKATNNASVDVGVGTHLITFKNPGAKDAERTIVVGAEGRIPDVAVELEPIPALLVVHCTPDDALVSVTGQGGTKTAAETKSAPLLVTLTSVATSRLEVVVAKKGFSPFVRQIDFQPSKTALLLDVVLEREGDVGAPP